MTLTLSSPRLVRTTSPVAPIQSPSERWVKASNSSVTLARQKSCTAPEESRSSANASLPWGRLSMIRPATDTIAPDSSPGSSADHCSATVAAAVSQG